MTGETRMTQPLAEVLEIRGDGMPSDTDVEISGSDPVFAAPFRIGETGAAVLAGVGVAVSDIWELKTGRTQKVSIDVRSAAAAMCSMSYLQQKRPDGLFAAIENEQQAAALTITEPWLTRDGRWFLPHFVLPNLKERVLGVLGCEPYPDSVQKAVARWDALDLEAAIADAGACGAMVRSNAEWLEHPHGKVLQSKPIVEITRIGESDPEPFPEGSRPLSGIRVLDLTRILAGPTAARTLAEHGAEVLMVAAEYLPQITGCVMDTCHGKRSCFLDLDLPEEAAHLKQLILDADVFSEGYRPGALEGRGFGPEELAELRPGMVYVSISCFGEDGPLSHRAGWEQVAQCVTGICMDYDVNRPRIMYVPACDYMTGYLGAYGALLALARRAREGGSYHVRVSLCQSGMFLYRQGKTACAASGTSIADAVSGAELEALRTVSETGHGQLRHLGPVLNLSETPPYWAIPTPVLGADQPVWLNAA